MSNEKSYSSKGHKTKLLIVALFAAGLCVSAPALAKPKILLVGYTGSYVAQLTAKRLKNFGVSVTIVDSTPSPSMSVVKNNHILWIHGSDVPFNSASINAIRDWVKKGGRLVVQQPDSAGPVTVFPPGYEVSVSNDTGNEAAWEVVHGPMPTQHPVVRNLTGINIGTSLDVVPVTSVGKYWSVLANGKMDSSYVGLLAGEYGKGRMVFTAGSLVLDQWWDAGSNKFIEQLLGWLSICGDGKCWGLENGCNCKADCNAKCPQPTKFVSKITSQGIYGSTTGYHKLRGMAGHGDAAGARKNSTGHRANVGFFAGMKAKK